MTRLGIIGTGSLGTTLLRAIAAHAPEIALIAANRDPLRIEMLRREIPSLSAAAPEEVARDADLVLLCVPPQVYLPLVERIAPHLGPRTILVSVTNSVSLNAIGTHVSAPVIKVIPTLAHVVGRGVALLIAGPRAQPKHIDMVRDVFAHFSMPMVIDGRDDRVASNVAGSALALFAALCDTFVTANAERAETLDRQTLDGMMAETLAAIAALTNAGYAWSDIVRATATPGGMTEAALSLLMSRFPQIARNVVASTFVKQAELQGPERISP